MPTISMFYGIIVYMYNEKGGKHNIPHIHAEYSGEEIVLSLSGEFIEPNSYGTIQFTICPNKLKMLEVWIDIHREELEANWKLLSSGEKHFRIEPLK